MPTRVDSVPRPVKPPISVLSATWAKLGCGSFGKPIPSNYGRVARHPPRTGRRVTWLYFARCRRARIATPMSCGRQACAANREEHGGARVCWRKSLLVSLHHLLIDGTTLSIRRVEYDIEREIKAL